MVTVSTIKHLRIPFSIFLMPIFLFAVANNIHSSDASIYNTIIAFVVLHIFVYPASNGYNSYFDKDEGSIGGLKHPPKVTRDLYWTALIFDVLGIGLALFISWEFTVMVFLYGMVSKAYSHPMVRLKKYPFISWWTVGLFQGGFTYLMSSSAALGRGFDIWLLPEWYIPAALATILLLGSYPMTQIYQHEEDAERGDRTISLVVGIKGTFYLTATFFTFGMLGFFGYYSQTRTLADVFYLLAFLSPVFLYFSYWFWQVLQSETNANFDHAMRFNAISSICLIIYFGWLAIGG